MTEAEQETAQPEVTLDARRLGLQIVVFGLVIMGGIIGFGYLFWEPMHTLSGEFVRQLGGFGIALGFFAPDAFSIPLPVDAFSTFGLLGGMPFGEVVLWGSVGSISGGCVGYHVGGWLRQLRWFARFTAKKGAEMDALVDRYGVTALAVAALTPLPYSLACWACGALRMPFGTFLVVSLLRIPRIAAYLWLLQQGFLSITP